MGSEPEPQGSAGAEAFSAHSTSAPSSPLIRTHPAQLDGLRVVSAISGFPLTRAKQPLKASFPMEATLTPLEFLMRFQALSLDEDLLPQKI